MKANELMIGDRVKFPIGNEKIIDLPYIEGKGICASFSASATLFPVKVEELKPIPLSKEILEKNGFVINRGPTSWIFETEREDLIDIYGCWDYHLSINIEDTHGSGKGYRWMLNDFVIHYVHELQHALRLFRIDKEIVI